MEDSRRHLRIHVKMEDSKQVLILILVEDSRRPIDGVKNLQIRVEVLILILVEDSRRPRLWAKY